MSGFKIGDVVRIRLGVIGAGQTGVIEKIEPWNLDSPYPDYRENFHYVLFEDGTREKFRAHLLENTVMDVTFTKDEVAYIYELLDQLSGNNVRHCFAWDGEDDPKCSSTSALVKIFNSVGAKIPENLRT